MKQRILTPIHSFLDRRNNTMDIAPILGIFLILVFILVAFGLVELYSVTFPFHKTSFFFKQLAWICVGFSAGAVILFIGTKKISDWSPAILVGLLLALASTRFFSAVNGAHRWIRFAGISIQPSEFAKVGITLFLAKYLAFKSHDIERRSIFGIWKGLIFVGSVIIMVFVGEDLGTTILLCALCAIMIFIAGVSPLLISGAMLIAGTSGYFIIKNFDAMRWKRLTVFLNPEPVSDDAGYQIWRSLLALGSGNWLGRGIGSSRLKMKYLPEAHTDFILAIVGEELGFITILAVIAIYLVLTLLGYVISVNARTRQNKFIAFGMITFIALQAIINIGVICAAMPTKGMPAPFISYGGSNMVTCIMAVACITSVALDTIYPDYAERNMERLKYKLRKLFRKNKNDDIINSINM